MLKVLLVAVNSKFTHTSLSVRSLSANTGGTEFAEFTINEELTNVTAAIFKKHPDILCFSCYIWNIEYVLKLASALKKMLPGTKIILGGPEVTFRSEEILENNKFISGIIRGEGEEIFKNLLCSGFDFKNVRGVTYVDGGIIKNPDAPPVKNLDILVFPYTDSDLKDNSDKLIYYESSRGCPYNCSYCLSSTEHGVRFKSVEKVKEELTRIIKAKPKTVKFVDRTFNADKKRTAELIKFMIEEGRGVTFHFEIEAHTLGDEFFGLVSGAPEGMFRFEIGLQSTNPETLRAINRNDKTESLMGNISKITRQGNVHVHLDLIAGLPFENYNTIKKSFNDALSLKPHVLQLGFLKMLSGTKIRKEAQRYGYVYRDYPPYEVISNKFLTCDELFELKETERLLDKFYNSGAFFHAIKYMRNFFGDYWSFFEKLKLYFTEKGLFNLKHSREGLYGVFADFAKVVDAEPQFFDLLKLDYFLNTKNASTPQWSNDPYNLKIHKRRTEIIEANRMGILREFRELPVRDVLKLIHFEVFSYRVTEDLRAGKWVAVFTKNGELLGEAEAEI